MLNSVHTQTELEGGIDGVGDAYNCETEKILIARPQNANATSSSDEGDVTLQQLEREANERMLQPPPPLPLQQPTIDSSNQQSTADIARTEIDYSDGFGLFLINKLMDFIHELLFHAATCGSNFELSDISFRDGAGITQTWKCSCGKTFTHKNCKWIRTDIVAPNCLYSRKQPELNIRLVKAAREVGVDMNKLCDLLAFIGVKASTYQNMLHQESKVRVAIDDLSEVRLKENLREHNHVARAHPNYKGDIEWNDASGVQHSTCQGPSSFDGAGLTRGYDHKFKGTRSGFIVFSSLTGKPIMIVYYSVSEYSV